jgi:ATP-dependent DNA ligase
MGADAHADYDPQLATIVKSPPSGDRWVHEIKYDGTASAA